MVRKIHLVNYFLFVLAIASFNSLSDEAFGQMPSQTAKPKRKHAENLKLIYDAFPEKLTGEANDIIHIGEKLISIDGGKKHFGDSISYRFNDKQQLTQEKVYNDEGQLKEKTIYKHDGKGNLILVDSKSYDGSGPFAVNFFYNDIGQIVSTKTTSSRGIEVKKYRYDELNYLLEKKSLDNNGTLWEMTNYFYDGKGNLVLFIAKSNEGDTIMMTKYAYNGLNQRIRREHSGEPINCAGRNKWQIKYNKVGDIIEEKTSDLTVTYKYHYDSKKNWTNQYNFHDDETQPNFLTTRVITYR
jgi:hypothetical protein